MFTLLSSCQEIQTTFATPFFIAGPEQGFALCSPQHLNGVLNVITAETHDNTDLFCEEVFNQITDFH